MTTESFDCNLVPDISNNYRSFEASLSREAAGTPLPHALTDEEAAIAVVALSEALSDVSDALAAIGVLSTHLSAYFAMVAQAASPSKE